VTYRCLTGSFTTGVSALLLAASLAGASVGCSKKKQEVDPKATAEKVEAERKLKQGDRYADGQRLAGSLREYTKRWADTADLPDCSPLLKDAAELELCKTATSALTTLKAAVAKPEPEAVLIHAAAELAYTTEAAAEKLRTASMARLGAEHAAAAPSSSVAGKKAPPPAAPNSASAKAKALSSAARAALSDKLKAVEAAPVDPAMQVMQAYSRVNRVALRYLSQFLQFGALPTRKAAFVELEGLAKRRESWPALGRTLREAAMAENDAELQGQLKALAPKLSRRSVPATPALLQGMPPGHLPMPPAGGAPPPEAPPAKEP
jgi:hypothetical protein